MSSRLIGILAGMGPRSTAPFVDLVLDECQRQYGARHDVEFPRMMTYSLPVPFYPEIPLCLPRPGRSPAVGSPPHRRLSVGRRHRPAKLVRDIPQVAQCARQVPL